ncbi:MAG: hypothetical protein GF311_05905 [Candidatus Lokiarchaeota archaeon]|nr:hypothetical protein [Candidatus Lokiarchaeota archaeon]
MTNRNQRITFIILFAIGILIRILALAFYYWQSFSRPIGLDSFGDVYLNFYDIDSIFSGEWIWSQDDLAYPPLSIYILVLLRLISFNNLYIFFFYSFLIEILIIGIFYLVLKRFNVSHYRIIFGFFLVNPFYFMSFVFRGIKSGYHLTDSFFCIFLLLAIYFYPNQKKSLFYLFSGLAVSAKWYTLPFLLLVFIKFFREKDWEEMKHYIFYTGIPIFTFLISPVFYLPNYLDLYTDWLSGHAYTAAIPLYYKIIPFLILLAIGCYKAKDFDLLDLTAYSILVMVSILWWSRLYVRYLAPLIYFGHISKPKEIYTFEIKISEQVWELKVDNHVITYLSSCIAVFFLIIIAIYEYSYFGLI